MPPATAPSQKKECMAIFHTGGQLGAVGAAVMCAAADQAPGFIDAETGEDMEESLTAEEVKQGILSGKYKPCTQEHIYHLFPPKDKK